VVNEVIKGNTYRKLTIQPGDTVLDVGMNIGMFTIWALLQGAKQVFGFEPSPQNFILANRNIKLNELTGAATTYEKAVVGTDDTVRQFALNVKKNKGAHSLVSKRGRNAIEVECENFQKILERIKPNVIKMDIEGGEYEIITAGVDFKGVREFIMEFHHAHLNDVEQRSKYEEVIGILKGQFPNVDYRPETKKAWVSLVHCTR
jgi:FkbM family methyltransferase